MSDTLPEGFKPVSQKPETNGLVGTTTLWCGEWIFGMANFKDDQYYSVDDPERMIDTPSGWKY